MTLQFSPQQAQAIQTVSEWYRRGDEPVFYLAGYAGTGKSTLAKHLVTEMNARPCYGAYTGKAAAVMRANGCAEAGTLHGKIYTFSRDEATGRYKKRVNRTKDSPIKNADIVVVDECSQVDCDLGNDLMSFGKPILVLGDPAQLPPVNGGGFFTAREPDVMLTEIHRQAEDNPIIHLASKVRKGEQIELGQYGSSAVVTRQQFADHHDITKADQVLVGRNDTRMRYNTRLRELDGRCTAYPEVGERLVCLKNDRDKQIFNGGIYEVQVADKDDNLCLLKVISEDEPQDEGTLVSVREEFFTGGRKPDWTELRGTQEFTYGYALTVHKAQGSQWDNVVLFDEAFGTADEQRRWRYTAITRAAQSVIMVRR